MLSSNVFCLPCLLTPFTVPCKMVLARPGEQKTCPHYISLRLLTMVRGFSCGPVACWILVRTSSLVTWSLYEMRSILRHHLISMACILCSSAVKIHDSQAFRKMDVTWQRIICILKLREMLLSFQISLNLVHANVICAILESISGLKPSSLITEPRNLKTKTRKE